MLPGGDQGSTGKGSLLIFFRREDTEPLTERTLETLGSCFPGCGAADGLGMNAGFYNA